MPIAAFKFGSGDAAVHTSVNACIDAINALVDVLVANISGQTAGHLGTDGTDGVLRVASTGPVTMADTGAHTDLDVTVDDSSIEVSSNALQIKALGVDTAELAANSVTSAKLSLSALALPICFSEYLDKNQKNLDTTLHGKFSKLVDNDAISTGVDIVFNNGLSKLYLNVVAGSDVVGDITITGTSVNRDTGAETGSDTEVLAITELTNDASTTDSNSNVVHDFTEGYLSAKWWKGSVTLSTTTVNISDVDIWAVAFEQCNDATSFTLTTFDITATPTNTAAWANAHIYSVMPTAGSKADITSESDIGIDAADVTANAPVRLREGAIGTVFAGATEGFFADLHLGPDAQTYWESVSIKIWVTEALSL